MTTVYKLIKKIQAMPYNKRQLLVILGVILILVAIPVTASLIKTNPQFTGQAAVEQWNGTPTVPMPVAQHPDYLNWDVQIHSRDQGTWPDNNLESMQADHGANCAGNPSPALFPRHTVSTYKDAVFICNNHLMTAINAGGYGMLSLTPNWLVDISQGAEVSFEMSTWHMSNRDWVDFHFSSWDKNLALPITVHDVDLQDAAADAVGIVLGNGYFTAFNQRKDPPWNIWYTNGEDLGWRMEQAGLQPDKARRDKFIINISKTRIEIRLGINNQLLASGNINPPLPFDQAVFTIGHHSYNPTKGDPRHNGDIGLPSEPGTWHWDNFDSNKKIPFTIIHSDRRALIGGPGTTGRFTFAQASPANSWLRFSAFAGVELSWNNGQTWQSVQPQPGMYHNATASYFVPMPAGETHVDVRFANSAPMGTSSPYHLKDVNVWSQTASTTPPPQTCTKLADLNCDNSVNVFDLSILLGKWATSDSVADLNDDGTVNVFDLSTLLSRWGS